MKLALIISIGNSLLSMDVLALSVPDRNWYIGEMNCEIDKRPAKMKWEQVSEWVDAGSSGDIVRGYETTTLSGSFSDNGGTWNKLQKQPSSNSLILKIRYLGTEPNNWQLTYDTNKKLAEGWTTWRGQRYPLSCWKGQRPTATLPLGVNKEHLVASLASGVDKGRSAATLPFGIDSCKSGYVWREAGANDHVCVTGDVREQARKDNAAAAERRSPTGGAYGADSCKFGYVWREAFEGDHVCVTGNVREQARKDNAAAASRYARNP